MNRLNKLKKGVISIIISAIMMFGLLNFVQAANAGPLYLGIELYRSSGYGYRQGTQEIFKILSYTSTDKTSRVSGDKTIYCIKGGVGFGGSSASKTGAIAYTNKFDLKNVSAIQSPYKDALPTGENYNKLMWVLDHLFMMPENSQEDNTTERKAFLANVIPNEAYETITNDDIDVVQQMAIWYFTNPDDNWHFGTTNLKIKKLGEEYTSIYDIDEDRDDAITALYDYYITSAPANYVSPTIEANAKPIQIEDKSDGTMQIIGANYVAGPYKINKTLDVEYDITATYNDGNITPVLGIKDQSGNIVTTNKTLKELEGQEFYLIVPTSSDISQLKMQIDGSFKVRKIWYWSAESALTEQPVAIIEADTQYFSDAIAAKVEEKKIFDLSLRKFITEINGKRIEELGLTSRVPTIEGLEALKNGTSNTAIYKHLKTPVKVDIGDIVTYTIRVYNEGELDGYVTEITDHLPEQLEYLKDDSTNLKYGWKYDTGDTHTIKTNFLSNADGTTSENPDNNKIAAFDETKLDYRDVQIRCKVVSTANMPKKITNIAEITGCKDIKGNIITNPSTGERDSTVKNVTIPADLPSYKDQEINRQDPTDPDYIPGQEDDDDFEKLILKEFDLSLKKFITAVNDTEITNREPQVDVSPLKATGTTATYTYKISPEKNPVVVANSDIVTYTIRIYNEGEASGYAEKVRDDIPSGLEFLPDNSINKEYRWKMYDENNNETTDVSKAKTIATDYLSKAQEEATGRTNLLNAFEMTNTTLDYKDVKVAFKVIEPNSSKNIIINKAQIADDSNNDRDSTTDEWIDGEDDQDIEKIKLKEFDLSLKKFVTKVNDEPITNREPQVDVSSLKDGKTTANYTYKINPEKDPVAVSNSDIVTYTIRVYNESEVNGYAEKIRDDIPSGLEFLPDNSVNTEYRWKMYDENNNETTDVNRAKSIATDYLSKAQEQETGRSNILTAFNGSELAYKDIKVSFKVTEPNSSKNIIINKAQIAEDSSNDRDSTPDEWKDGEDDQDIEKIKLKDFDLSLRKFITAINDTKVGNRIPQIDVSSLATGTTATYNHTKQPLEVDIDDLVEYTIRVYNEGDSDGYVTEITDYLPKQLEFVADNQINIDNNWKMYDENNNQTTDTSKAVKIKTDKIRDERITAFDGKTLAYKDVKVVCKVISTANMPKKITNIAEISKCENLNRVEVKGKDSGDERDSNPNKVNIPTGTDLENYKDDEINKEYVPGQEDDDDFEKLILKEFDLSLRKFITAVNDKTVTNREPQVDVSPLKNGKTTANYTYKINPEKDPVAVENSDIVTYTIRVYNEGGAKGYAEKIRDDIPSGLEFLPDNSINTEYRWKMYDENNNETTDVSRAKSIATDYLSRAQEQETGKLNILTAFNGSELAYKDIKVAFKVTEPNSSKNIIINKAQIAEDSNNDRDSTPDEWKDDEDDQDIEKIKLKDFDLSLRKFITAINDAKVTDRIPQIDVSSLATGTTATYNHTKQPLEVDVDDLVEYTIRVYNEGDSDGYVTEITDYLPKQLELVIDNQTNIDNNWKMYDENNNETTDASKAVKIKTDKIRDERITAFDGNTLAYKEVKVVCRVVETENMVKKITNIAEISKCENSNRVEVKGKDLEDERDSNPNRVTIPTGTDLENYKDDEINKEYVPGQEDDDDFEKLILKEFDLSLKKFITAVNETAMTNREPQVDVSPLKNGQTTASYTYKINPEKDPVAVENSDIVTYTIRVYNEGGAKGYAEKIRDDIPSGLEFLPEHSINTEYRWKMYDENNNETTDVSRAKSIATDYLSKTQEKETGRNNILSAFDENELSYRDVKVAFKVTEPNSSKNIIINKAQIAEDSNNDRDSTPDEWEDGEDDQDIEQIKLKDFDLSLKKFITAVNDTAITNREPQVDVSPLKNGQTTANYTYKIDPEKDPVVVENSDVVTYTIRVYNEGGAKGYAEKIRDDIPSGLEFLPDNSINTEYRWKMYDENNNETTDVSRAKSIATDYLSKTQEQETGRNNILSAFDGNELSYRDAKVAFKVTEPNSSKNIIINKAQIAEDSNNDRDSTPDEWKDGEDDQDIEKIKLKDFDLSLRKFITAINNTKVTDRIPQIDVSSLATGTTATYNHTKQPLEVDVDDLVEYTIRVYNEGGSDGYVTEITDYLPKQLEFVADNQINIDNNWKMYDENNNETTDTSKAVKIKTDKIRDERITAFDGNTLTYKEVKVVCKVVKTDNIVKKITNIAEISKCENSNRVEVKGKDTGDERDSNPNKVNVPTGTDLENYKDDEINKEYVPGQEDDDDFEKIILKDFDLSLKKFITAVNDTAITNREPQVDVSLLKNGQTTAKYTYKIDPEKAPVAVENSDIVTYTIRVYNEGGAKGYAEKIRDDIPSGLEFLPDNSINTEYRWKMYDENNNETTDVSRAKSIATDYLSKEQEQATGRNNILSAFDGNELSYRDVKVAFKVTEPNSSKNIIINKAQIAEDSNNDRDSTPDEWKDGEDDQDIEKIKLKDFDLSLRKFITAINDAKVTDRIPQIDVSSLATGTTATYNHTKQPLEVDVDDLVEYTIRVYNEGDSDGYVTEITDYLPKQLELVTDNKTNIDNNWKMYDASGNETQNVSDAVKIKTDKIRDERITAFDGNTLAYKEVKVVCRVVKTDNIVKKITNIAEISKCENSNRVVVKGKDTGDERDSNPDKINIPTGTDLENYKDDEINKEYVLGQEDDDDFEKLILKEFDLSLRKFITAVNDTAITNREPQVDVTPLKEKTGTTAIYEHTKEPVLVSNGNVVEYTIRVYNEGNVSGYAQEVKDDIPEGLEFLPENSTNKEYRWAMLDENGEKTTDVSKAKTITTDYLSKEQEKIAGVNLIKAFDPETMNTLDYKDVKVAFTVAEPSTSDRIIINKAQISKDSHNDIDSTPDEWKDGEDDQDTEKVKVQYFDLSLRKWVTQSIVIEDGQEKITETGHTAEDDPEAVAKVDLKKSKIDTVTVKFRFKIRVKNEGTIAGYAKEIKDYIPDGLKFVEEDNPLWTKVDGKTITTDQCKDKLLKPGDTTEAEVVLTWINGEDNMGTMDNWAEISKDYNEYGSPDIDSTPDNNKKGEDDIDDAPVMVTVQTGEIAKYTVIAIAVLTILTTGVVLIKKYVLN